MPWVHKDKKPMWGRSRGRNIYSFILHEGGWLKQLGFEADGSLYNPNGYDPDLVRTAVAGTDERVRIRRSAAAKEAAVTRAERTRLLVMQIAEKIVAEEATGPSSGCIICGKTLTDPESIARGIGSECWQHVLQAIEEGRLKARERI